MCVSVAAMAGIGLAMSGVGTLFGVKGALDQGTAAKQAADYNAAAMRATAQSVEAQGAQAATDKLQKARRVEASQVAAAGAGGVDPFSGSPLQVESQTAELGELDALRIINNAQRTAWGYKTQAGITEWEGDQAKKASYWNAGATLLGGAGRAFYGYGMLGMGGGPGGTPPIVRDSGYW